MQNAATTRILSGPVAGQLSKGVWKGKRRGRREEVERSLRKTMRIRRPSCRCAEPRSHITSPHPHHYTTRGHGLYHCPHFADEKSETQRGEVTGPRRNGRVREAGFGNSEAAGLRQHPKRRGLRPSPRRRPAAAGAGRPKVSFRPARAPGSRPPRFARGPGGPGVLRPPSPRLPGPGRPPGPGAARGPSPGGKPTPRSWRGRRPRRGQARGAVGGRGPGGRPRATHASNLLFILSPSPPPHGVTSAPPGPSA